MLTQTENSLPQLCPAPLQPEMSVPLKEAWKTSKKINFFLVLLLQQRPTVDTNMFHASIFAFYPWLIIYHDQSSESPPYAMLCSRFTVPVLCSVKFSWRSQQNLSISGNARADRQPKDGLRRSGQRTQKKRDSAWSGQKTNSDKLEENKKQRRRRILGSMDSKFDLSNW